MSLAPIVKEPDAATQTSFGRVLDAFALSGMLGLPAPVEKLQALDELRTKQSAEESALVDDRLRLLREEGADTEKIRDSARNQLDALPGVLDSLAAQESDLAARELDLLRRRASVSSSLASRRASYPHRVAAEKDRAFSELVDGITKREQIIAAAIANDPHTKAAADRLRAKDAEREGLLRSARVRMETAVAAVEGAETRLRRLETVGLTRATSGFLTFTGLSALAIIGVVLGVQLAWLPGRPLDLISSVLAVAAAGVIAPLRQLGPVKAAAALIAAWIIVTALMWLTLWVGDVLLGRVTSRWNTSSNVPRDRLPGLWAGGEGRVATRRTLHQRLARLPFLATACIPALLFLFFAAWDVQFGSAVSALTFWPPVVGGLLGMAVVGVTACLAVVWAAPQLAAIQEGQVASRVRHWWPAWIGLAFSLAAVPVPGSTVLVPIAYVGQLGWLAAASIAFAIGLVTSANHRTSHLLKAQLRSAEREILSIVNDGIELTPTRLEQEFNRAREAIQAQFNSAMSGEGEGALSFLRPTRRFFNTPQVGDDLDKATLEEYSGADALFEPELLTQLFDARAELQQLRVQLVSVREARKAKIAEGSHLQESINDSSVRLRQLFHEREDLVRRFSRSQESRILQHAEAHSSTAAAIRMGDLFRVEGANGEGHDVTT